MRRVLHADGWAVLDAPVDRRRASKYEDPTITTPAGRRRAFHQWDHVRLYGRDYVDRLTAGGFTVQPGRFSPSAEESLRWGLRPDEDVLYYCRPR